MLLQEHLFSLFASVTKKVQDVEKTSVDVGAGMGVNVFVAVGLWVCVTVGVDESVTLGFTIWDGVKVNITKVWVGVGFGNINKSLSEDSNTIPKTKIVIPPSQ